MAGVVAPEVQVDLSVRPSLKLLPVVFLLLCYFFIHRLDVLPRLLHPLLLTRVVVAD